jgi:hypothetical protein
MGKKLVQRIAIKKLLNDDIFGDTILTKYRTNKLAKQILDNVWGFLCNPHNSRGSLPFLSSLNPVELGRISVLYNKRVLGLSSRVVKPKSLHIFVLSPFSTLNKENFFVVIRLVLFH